MVKITGVLLFVLSCAANAATGTISYTRPTSRVDGSPLLASEIASYSLACTYTPTGGVAAPCASLLPTSFGGASLGGAVTFTVSADGRACFVLRTVDTGGRQSDPSAQACKDVVVAIPNPPGNVVVAFNVTIGGQSVGVDPVPLFGVSASGKRLATVYGFARAGTACIGEPVYSYRGRDYYRVARADVGWWETAPNDNAAAPCA